MKEYKKHKEEPLTTGKEECEYRTQKNEKEQEKQKRKNTMREIMVVNPKVRELAQYLLDYHGEKFNSLAEVLEASKARVMGAYEEGERFKAAGGDILGAEEIINEHMYAGYFFSLVSVIDELSEKLGRTLDVTEQVALVKKAESLGLFKGYEFNDKFEGTDKFDELEDKLILFLKSEFN